MNEAVDSKTSQGAFRKMAVCLKCEIDDGHLNSLLSSKRQKILGEFNLFSTREMRVLKWYIFLLIGENIGGQGEDAVNFT